MRAAAGWAVNVYLPILVALALAATFLLDRAQPQAGAWVLTGLTLTAGFAHGALDAALLQHRSSSWLQLAAVLTSYLLVVVFLGWLLSSMLNVALWLLILMSVWHFGEPYGRWNSLQPWAANLTRAVVGGAPIMLPVWLAPVEFAQALTPVVNSFAVDVWRWMAMVWLALVVGWVAACGFQRPKVARHAWAELVGCAAAYVLFSPLMAFALYFGAYHAPVHIWRVWRGWTNTTNKPAVRVLPVLAGLFATLAATWLLGAGLWWLLSPDWSTLPDPAAALQWVIVALAAVTAPHLILISASATFFAASDHQPIP